MRRYKCIVSYDGSSFFGYQLQPNKRTIQGEIENVLQRLHKGQYVRIQASGRTDAGVHAIGQVFHFDSPLQIPMFKWEKALNSLLPKDITIKEVEEVSIDFHSRFDVVGKEYRYFVHLTNKRDPFRRNFVYSYPFSLDSEAIKRGMSHLIGTHDFTSFCSAKTEVENKVRTIYFIKLIEENDMLIFKFSGNGFLYNMVRIMVGTLLEIGRGDREPDSILEVLEKRDRSFAGKTAPAEGLYLWEVKYR